MPNICLGCNKDLPADFDWKQREGKFYHRAPGFGSVQAEWRRCPGNAPVPDELLKPFETLGQALGALERIYHRMGCSADAPTLDATIRALFAKIAQWEAEHEDWKLEAGKDALRLGMENTVLKARIAELEEAGKALAVDWHKQTHEIAVLKSAAEKLLVGMGVWSLAEPSQAQYHFRLASGYAAELSKLVRGDGLARKEQPELAAKQTAERWDENEKIEL